MSLKCFYEAHHSEDYSVDEFYIEHSGEEITDAFYYDIDCDNEPEIVTVSSIFSKELLVFEKTDEGYKNSAIFGMRKFDWADEKIKLYTYDYDGEKFPFFVFHFVGGIMECDVIAAIVYDENGDYNLEYKLSWGTIDYPDESLYGGTVELFSNRL